MHWDQHQHIDEVVADSGQSAHPANKDEKGHNRNFGSVERR
jgi:hypothetical protein